MRRVTPNQHRLEYGETLSWSPPEGAVKFLVWTQPRVFTFDDLGVGATESAYGGPAPAWTEAGGYDITADEKITPEKGAPLPGAEATVAGVSVTWAALMTLSQGLMTEVLQIIAYDTTGKATQIDRYSVPAPSSTDASVIAAQERRVLQNLLAARETAAATGGRKRIGDDTLGEIEYENIGVIDRRIAEVRSRIAWFSQAAAGNTLPRQEFW